MTKSLFITTGQIYTANNSCTITVHLVGDDLFEAYCRFLITLRKELADDGEDDLWASIFSSLYKLRNAFTTGLAPFNYPRPFIDHETLNNSLNRARIRYNQYTEPLLRLQDMVRQLTSSHNCPLFDALIDLESVTSPLLVVRNRTDFEYVSQFQYGPDHRNFRLSPRIPKIPDDNAFDDTLILVGPPAWHPKWVFTAPRFHNIHIFTYSWMNNTVPRATDFMDDLNHPNTVAGINVISNDPVRSVALANAPEHLPTIDTKDWLNRTSGFEDVIHAKDSQSWENIPARLYFLTNDQGVLLEDGANFRSDILELSDDGNATIKRIRHSELQQGMFLLLRTQRDHDHLLTLSYQLLGEDSVYCQQCQYEWKSKLQTLIGIRTLSEISRELTAYNAQHATEINIRNWASHDTIGPRRKEDFRALLKLLNIEENLDAFWQVARHIRRARTAAGFRIRASLLEKARMTDVTELELEGEYTFLLDDEVGGSIRALRIEGISEETYEVSRQQTRVILSE